MQHRLSEGVSEGGAGTVQKSEMYAPLEGFLEEMAQAEYFRWGWGWSKKERYSRQKNLPF